MIADFWAEVPWAGLGTVLALAVLSVAGVWVMSRDGDDEDWL